MIYALDTYYYENQAKTVCIGFKNWEAETENIIYESTFTEIGDYESGSFFKRELPCVLDNLQQIQLTKDDVIIVDGYVILNDDGKLGLGGYLHKELGKEIPIIGVAKNLFKEPNQARISILRGESTKPLYITSLGITVEKAAENIKKMHGDFRIPTLLKKVDMLGRIE